MVLVKDYGLQSRGYAVVTRGEAADMIPCRDPYPAAECYHDSTGIYPIYNAKYDT